MKSIASILASAAILAGGSVSNAQQQITECSEADAQNCATTSNRVCYNYADTSTTECGYCLPDYFEYEDECYAINDIGTDAFLFLAEMLEAYLPNYVDQTISTEERALRLIVSTKVISYWNSQVPPPDFKLGLTNETFLTEDEWLGRLGQNFADITYVDSGPKGAMERLEFTGSLPDGFGNGDDENDEEGRRKLIRSRILEELPAVVDWHEGGYTTMVKNQGLCGCCWAVSVAAAVESSMMITGQTSRDDGEKNNLSFQQMISCDNNELGCGGGNILQATRYVWEHDDFKNSNFGGLVSYEDWPYSDFFGETTTECAMPENVTPKVYLNYPKVVNSVNDRSSFEERRDRLMYAVSMQPVASVLRSACPLLMNYEGGVLTHDSGCECCETSCIDHAIVIVGYDTSGPTPYWKLRNSWGDGWGEEGHFRIAMNDAGACGNWGLFGMLAEASAPSDAYTSLEDLPERPSYWETAQTWEKVIIILFSILGFCCLCGCLGMLCKKRRG